MMIRSISIKNWRTHKDSKMEFDAGTNVIVGVMGAGKSSVVNAMSFALFGTFPALKSKHVALEEIIMAKPSKTDEAKVEIELGYDEKEYRIERTIKSKGTNSAKLFENGKLLAGPKQKDVNERVEKLLGISYDLFSRAIYSEQNEIDFFLKLSPRDRKEKFDDLLDLKRYEAARKAGVSLRNSMEKRNREAEASIKQQKKDLNEEEEEELKRGIEKEKKEVAELEKSMSAAQKNVLVLEKNLKEAEEKEKESRAYEELLAKAEARIETLRENQKKYGKISLEAVEKNLEKAKKGLEEKEEAIAELKKEAGERAKEAGKTLEEIRVLEYRKKKSEEELKGIGALGGKCPVCKQELNEAHRERILKENREKIREAERDLGELEKKRKETERLSEALEKGLKEKEGSLEEAKKGFYALEESKEKAKEAEEEKKQLEKLSAEPKNLKEKIRAVGFKKADLDRMKDEYYKKKGLIESAEARIGPKKELIKSHESNLEKILRVKKTVEEFEKSLSASKKAASNLGVFSNCLVATQAELREKMITELNGAMSTIWESLYPYKDYIDAKLAVSEEGYGLTVRNRNREWVRVEGILSGGERSAAAICIRIAFALVLTKNLSMLILDEPTHNLDSNAIGKLSEMLRERLPSLVDQVFIITHDKELEKAASANMYVLCRNKDLDEATRIEAVGG